MTRKPAPLAFKPDIEDAAKRWDAFYAGEIIDRPVVCVTAPRPGVKLPPVTRRYYDKVHSGIDDILSRALERAEGTFFGGEAVPTFNPSFGPDEISVFCGAEFAWSQDSPDTNWSVPFVEDWAKALPLRLHDEHPLWQRMLKLYRRAAERLAGKMVISSLDLHTNMDLLSGIRGPQRLCMDLLDCPEMIDRAMADARAIFPQIWRTTAEAGRMDELGYCHGIYSMEGAAYLQCDFSCMMSPAMFRRWVLPALEEEAQIVKHVVYHWDGPGALVHTNDLLASRGLHSLSYVPGAGRGSHLDHIELMKRIQAGGKAVQFSGNAEQIKLAHRQLKPEKVFYTTGCRTQAEAEALLDWFVKNT
ncbi:MAG: hypothetical protein FJ278_07960 [Planctomycetes bacterium]|nr:hypothetical protein [Planctomycetota bacterium]